MNRNRAGPTWPNRGLWKACGALPAAALAVGTLAACGQAANAHRSAAQSAAISAVRVGTGTPATTVLTEPNGGVRPLTRVIDRAQKTVFMEAYILSDSRVVRALERAAAQGVAVYVLLEPHPLGLGTQPSVMRAKLLAAGVRMRWAPPAFRLTHAKFMVVDDSSLVVSTANFSRAAFTSNREFLIFDRSPNDVRQASAVFRADWDRLPVTVHDANAVIAPQDARTRLAALLSGARAEVDVYGEEMLDRQTEEQLIGLARRGVRVRVLLPGSAARTDFVRVRRGGVAVRVLTVPYIHAKMMAVDRQKAFVGSENMSAASLDANRELGLLLRGRSVRVLVHTFEADWKRAGTG